MARAKSKDQKYRSTHAYIQVKDADRYMAQKLQHMIRQYEKMTEIEPWNVDPKKYVYLLSKFSELNKSIKRKRKAADVKKGVDEKRVDGEAQQEGSSGVREDKPFGVGS